MAELIKHSDTEVRVTTTVEEVVKLDLYLQKINQIGERIANLRSEQAKLQAVLDVTRAQYEEARNLGVKLSYEVVPSEDRVA